LTTTQLSLHRQKGPDVRLAAKLLQWKMNQSEEEAQEVEEQMQGCLRPATPIEQISARARQSEKLIAAGITLRRRSLQT